MTDQDALAPVLDTGLPDDGARGLIRKGLLIVAVVLGGLLLWSIFTRLDSAIVAPGQLGVEGNAKAIQHLEGGIVAEILVREGDLISAGDLLIRLDDTATRARATQAETRFITLLAERDRLKAERGDDLEIAFSSELLDQGGDQLAENQMRGQLELMQARRASRNSQISIQRQRQAQLSRRVSGFEAQKVSLERQFELLQVEREAFEKIGPALRVAQIERQAEAVRERMAGVDGEMAAQEEARAEARLVISQLTEGFQEQVVMDLQARENEIAEVRQTLIAVQDELRRTEIYAPHSGRVLALAVHTPGAVVRNGEELMRIVPVGETLVVRSQVRPVDVDKVIAGQDASLMFSSLGGRNPPRIKATVLSVSADALFDETTRANFYLATLEFDAASAELGNYTLTPGMPVEAFIRTDGQTVLSYLTRPLTESIDRTFIEE